MADNTKSVLIVEDEESLAELFKKAFCEQGFVVQAAANGEAALDTLTQFKPRAIVLDLILPRMSGFEVLKTIRSSSLTYFTPIVIVTNLSGEENVKQGLELGANDYLVKSHVRLLDIIEKVESIIKYQDRSNY